MCSVCSCVGRRRSWDIRIVPADIWRGEIAYVLLYRYYCRVEYNKVRKRIVWLSARVLSCSYEIKKSRHDGKFYIVYIVIEWNYDVTKKTICIYSDVLAWLDCAERKRVIRETETALNEGNKRGRITTIVVIIVEDRYNENGETWCTGQYEAPPAFRLTVHFSLRTSSRNFRWVEDIFLEIMRVRRQDVCIRQCV